MKRCNFFIENNLGVKNKTQQLGLAHLLFLDQQGFPPQPPKVELQQMEFPAAPEAAEAPEVGNEAPAVSVSAVETETSPVVPAPEEHLWPCSNGGSLRGFDAGI